MGSSTYMTCVLTKWWVRNIYPVFIKNVIFWLSDTFMLSLGWQLLWKLLQLKLAEFSLWNVAWHLLEPNALISHLPPVYQISTKLMAAESLTDPHISLECGEKN